MKCSDYELHACRNAVVDHLYDVWNAAKKDSSCDPSVQACWSNDIWRKANTLQALVQYWKTADASNPRRQKAVDMMWDGYQFYLDYLKTHTDPDSIWVDDFGWWGGFFQDFNHATGGSPPAPFTGVDLVAATQYCYDRMIKNLDTKRGGIWNHPSGSGSEKNTITNSWMLNLALELGNKKMAEEQYTWLTTGKYGSYSPPSWALYTTFGLLFWNPDPTASNGQYWSGDEGVFLRAITFYISTFPEKKAELLSNSKTLIGAAITPTEDFQNSPMGFPDTQNVMHESPGSDWSNDLATGKGVFMRLVTRFVAQYKYFGDSAFEAKFKTFVNATAESAWCSRDKGTGTTTSNWNPPYGPPQESNQPTSGGLWPWVYQTNALDALNAAVQISKDE